MGYTVVVESRDIGTRSELAKLRAQGMVPASVSGKQVTPVSIAIDEKELRQLLREHASEVLEMELPQQGLQHVVVQDVQRDKLVSSKLLHVDFHQISMNEPIKMAVPIEWVGDAPGVSVSGIMTPLLNELELRALPGELPASIQVDVSSLEIGDKLLVADLPLPSGVECLLHPDTVVVTIIHVKPQSEAEQEEIAAEADGKGGLKEHSGAKLSDRTQEEAAGTV